MAEVGSFAVSRPYGPVSTSAIDAYVFSRLIERVNYGMRVPRLSADEADPRVLAERIRSDVILGAHPALDASTGAPVVDPSTGRPEMRGVAPEERFKRKFGDAVFMSAAPGLFHGDAADGVLRADGVASEDGVTTVPGRGVTARTARAIYESFLEANPVSDGDALRGRTDRILGMYAAIRAVVPDDQCPEWLRRVTDGAGDPEVQALAAADLSGLGDEFNAYLRAGVTPMSPLHASLRGLSVFQNGGNAIQYSVGGADSFGARGGSRDGTDWKLRTLGETRGFRVFDLNDEAASNVRVYGTPEEAARGDDVDVHLRDAREWVAERSGAKALQAFMTAEEYEDITGSYGRRSWLEGADGQFMPESKIRLVAGLMSRLYDEGITYSVERDDRPGQVKIVFENGMSMRVIDPYDNGQYAGTRVYYKGLTVYYNQILFVPKKDGKVSSKTSEYDAMTPELSYQLVRAAMGGVVEHQSETYHNDENMRILTSVAGESRPDLGVERGEPIPEGLVGTAAVADVPVLSVYFENQMSSKAAEYSDDPESPMYGAAYVRECVESARGGVEDEFDLERVVDAAMAYRAERGRYDRAVAAYEAMTLADPDVAAERPRVEDYDLTEPEFSADPLVARYQQDFWAGVTGASDLSDGIEEASPEVVEGIRACGDAYRAGATRDELVAMARERVVSGVQDVLVGNLTLDDAGAPVSPADGGDKFDASGVTRYMQSRFGMFRRMDELVAAARAVRLSEDYCKGDGFTNSGFTERLRRYAGERDVEKPSSGKYYSRAAVDAVARGETDLSAYELSGPQPGFGYDDAGLPTHWPMAQDGDPFVRSMVSVVRDSMVRAGCLEPADEDIQIDMSGTVHYTAKRSLLHANKAPGMDGAKWDDVIGEVGPFCRQMGSFVGNPEVGSERYDVTYPGLFDDGKRLFVPGNEGRIVPNKPGESLPYEARIRARSYPQVFAEALERQLQLDLLKKPYKNRPTVTGTPTSVAYVTRHLFDTRFPRDFMEKDAKNGMSMELREAIVATSRARLKINDQQMTDAGRVALFRATKNGSVDFLNDNFSSAILLTGGRNPAILEPEGDDFFDPVLTGNGGAIGIRYLRADREVAPDGRIVPRPDAEIEALRAAGRDPSRCDIMDYLIRSGRCPDNDAMDRAIMTGQGLLHGLRETEVVGVAQVSLGAMTLEDGIVVSDVFADGNPVLSADDEPVMRSLTVGDKMECHGNKGVIGAVVRTRDKFVADYVAGRRAEAEAAGTPLTERQALIHTRVAEDEYESMLLRTRHENPILARAMDMFNANPGLAVCMSPYSSVSRFNGGLAAEAMRPDRVASDLRIPTYDADGFPVEDEFDVRHGCLGQVKMTILEQTADSKTHYEMDGSENRSYGAQMTWALAAADAQEVLKDSFANNDRALVNLREMLLAVGMDVDQAARIVPVDPSEGRGYRPQVVGEAEDGSPVYEERKVFQIPEPDLARAEADARAEFDAMTPEARADALAGCAAKHSNAKYGRRSMPDGSVRPALTGEGFMKLPDDVRATYERRYLAQLARKYVDEQGREAMRAFDAFAQRSGGFIEIPFDIKYPGYSSDSDLFHTAETFPGSGKFLLPVMSSRLRSGRESVDGVSTTHDYTNQYMKIVKLAWDYSTARKPDGAIRRLAPGLSAGGKEVSLPKIGKQTVDALAANAPTQAQSEYAKITSDLERRRFSGKRNVFRANLMAAKQRNSVTSIWTPDPSLPVDAVRMGSRMMRALGLDPDSTEDQYALIHRDPVLQQSGIRYMRVIKDPEPDESKQIIGLAVHPAGIPGGMDGDFDGDTAGGHKPGSRAARADAMRKLSVEANLLDMSAQVDDADWALTDPRTGEKMPVFKLFVADGQDVAAGHAANPVLRERREELQRRVNLFEQAARLSEAGYPTPVTLPGETEPCVVRERVAAGTTADGVRIRSVSELRREAMRDIDDYLLSCSLAGFGRSVISYEGPREHIQSILDFVEDGCKGSKGKVQTYAAHVGINYRADMENLDEVGFVHEDHRSVATREENIGILKSKEFQQAYTGMGGQASIRGMKILMDIAPDASTRVTKAMTQAILQCKHDAEMADIYEKLLMGDCREIWRSGEDGKYGVLTPEEFKERFRRTFNDEMKLGVSEYQLQRVTEALTVDGKVMDIEGDEALKFSSVLRQCAYGGTLETIQKIARETQAKLDAGEAAPGIFDVSEATAALGEGNYHDYGRCLAGRRTRQNLENGGAAVISARDTQFVAPTSNLVAELDDARGSAEPRLRVTSGSRTWSQGGETRTRQNAVGQIFLEPESSVFKNKDNPEAGHLYYVDAGSRGASVSADDVLAAKLEFTHDVEFLSRVVADIPGANVRLASFGDRSGDWPVEEAGSRLTVPEGEREFTARLLADGAADARSATKTFLENEGADLALGVDPKSPYALVYKTRSPSGEPQTITRLYSDPARMLEYTRYLAERVHEAWPDDEQSAHLEVVVPEDDLLTRYCCEAALTNGRGERMSVSKSAWLERAGAELADKRAAEAAVAEAEARAVAEHAVGDKFVRASGDVARGEAVAAEPVLELAPEAVAVPEAASAVSVDPTGASSVSLSVEDARPGDGRMRQLFGPEYEAAMEMSAAAARDAAALGDDLMSGASSASGDIVVRNPPNVSVQGDIVVPEPEAASEQDGWQTADFSSEADASGWARGDVGRVTFTRRDGRGSSTTVHKKAGAMLGESMFSSWVCMAAGKTASPKRVEVDVSYDVNDAALSADTAARVRRNMNRMHGHEFVMDVFRKCKATKVGKVFCGDPRLGDTRDATTGATMRFTATDKSGASVTAYRGYDDVSEMERQAKFLAGVIESRWPGAEAQNHKLTVELDELNASFLENLQRGLREVSPHGVDVVVAGREREATGPAPSAGADERQAVGSSGGGNVERVVQSADELEREAAAVAAASVEENKYDS